MRLHGAAIGSTAGAGRGGMGAVVPAHDEEDTTLFELTADDLILNGFDTLDSFGMGSGAFCMSPRGLKLSPEEAMLSPSMRRLPHDAVQRLLSPGSCQKRKRPEMSARDSLTLSAARTERLSHGSTLFGLGGAGGTPPTATKLGKGAARSELFAAALNEHGSASRPAAPQRSLFNVARPPASPQDSDISSPHTNSPPNASGPGHYMLGAIRSRPFRTITIRPVTPALSPAQEGAGGSGSLPPHASPLVRLTSLDSTASDGSVTRTLNSRLDRLCVVRAAPSAGGSRDAEMADAGAQLPMSVDDMLPISMCYDEFVASVDAAKSPSKQAAGGAASSGPQLREADKENAPTIANDSAAPGGSAAGGKADAMGGEADMRAAAAAGAGAGAGAPPHEGSPTRGGGGGGSARAQQQAQQLHLFFSTGQRRARARSEMLQPSQIVAIESDYQRRNQE